MAVDALPFQFSVNVVDQDVVWFSVFSRRLIGHSQLRISRLKLFYRRQLELVFRGGQDNRRLSLARSIQADTHVRAIRTEALPTQREWIGELQRLRWDVKLYSLRNMLQSVAGTLFDLHLSQRVAGTRDQICAHRQTSGQKYPAVTIRRSGL